jgi:hypothetical protein
VVDRRVEAFWREIWDFCGVIGDGPGARTSVDLDKMPARASFPTRRSTLREPDAPVKEGAASDASCSGAKTR